MGIADSACSLHILQASKRLNKIAQKQGTNLYVSARHRAVFSQVQAIRLRYNFRGRLTPALRVGFQRQVLTGLPHEINGNALASLCVRSSGEVAMAGTEPPLLSNSQFADGVLLCRLSMGWRCPLMKYDRSQFS
jgi:hypothetical protein